jgi:hypothetical protein
MILTVPPLELSPPELNIPGQPASARSISSIRYFLQIPYPTGQITPGPVPVLGTRI